MDKRLSEPKYKNGDYVFIFGDECVIYQALVLSTKKFTYKSLDNGEIYPSYFYNIRFQISRDNMCTIEYSEHEMFANEEEAMQWFLENRLIYYPSKEKLKDEVEDKSKSRKRKSPSGNNSKGRLDRP